MLERDPNQLVIEAVTWVMFLAPAVPLALAWTHVRRGGLPAGWRGRVQWGLLALLTLSAALLVAGILWAEAIGTNYTERRLVTVWTNLCVAAASAVAGGFTRGGVRLELVTTGALLASAWFYLAVIGAAI